MTDPRYATARAHLANADPRMATLVAARPDYDPRAALAELPTMDPFGVLLFQIIGQQISVPATRAILARLVTASSGRLPGPADLLQQDPAVLLAAGLSARKAATMRAAAEAFLRHGLSDATLQRMADAQIVDALTTVPGIGTWTVQGFLVIALDRPDAFPAGDLAIRRAIRDLYHLDDLPSEEETEQRAENWRPYRALAAGYLISWDAGCAQRRRADVSA